MAKQRAKRPVSQDAEAVSVRITCPGCGRMFTGWGLIGGPQFQTFACTKCHYWPIRWLVGKPNVQEEASSIETVHEDTCSYCHTTGPFLRRTDGLWICWECREVQQRNIH